MAQASPQAQQLFQQTLQATALLYNGQSQPAQIAQANKFLSEDFIKHPEGWAVLNLILSRSDVPTQAHSFAATQLRNRLTRRFREIPQQNHAGFRNTLLAHIRRFSQNKQVVTSLAQSIACLAVQMPEWVNIYPDLVQQFQGPENAIILLSVLTYLPEQQQDRKIPISNSKRHNAGERIKKFAVQVLGMLEQFLASSQNQRPLQVKVMKCFAAWASYTGVLQPMQMAKTPLLAACFQLIAAGAQENNFELFNTCVEALVEILQASQELEQWQAVATVVIPNIIKLQQTCAKVVSDEQYARGVVQLYVEMGVSYMQWLLNFDAQASAVLAVLLQFTVHPNNDVAAVTFEFWEMLVRRIQRAVRVQAQLGTAQKQKVLPYLQKLVPNVLRTLQYPNDFEEMDKDEQEEFMRHRYAASEVLCDVAEFITANNYIGAMFSMFQNAVQKNQGWQSIEAALYGIRSTARVVKENDKMVIDQVLPKIFAVLPQVSNHFRIRYTGTLLIGRYSHFFARAPQVVPAMIKFVVEGLNNEKLAPSAALSLKHVCDQCPQLIGAKYMPQLIQVYNGSAKLDNDDQVELIEGLSYCVSVLPIEKLIPTMQALIKIPYTDIQSCLNNTNRNPKLTLKDAMLRLATIFKFVQPTTVPPDQDHPCLLALIQLWPLLQQMMTQLHDQDGLMERCIKIIKAVIRIAPVQYSKSKLFATVLQTVTQLFLQSPNSCFLYVICIYCDEYGSNPTAQQPMSQVLAPVNQKIFTILTNQEAFRDKPDLVEDYFELLVKYLKKCPNLILNPEILPPVFQCALSGVLVSHREANAAVMEFYHSVLSSGYQLTTVQGVTHQLPTPSNNAQVMQLLKQLLEKFGLQLVKSMLEAIAGAVPHGRVRNMVDTMEALYNLSKEMLLQLMRNCLMQMKEQTEEPTKEEFLKIYFSPPTLPGMEPTQHRARAVRDWEGACDRWNGHGT